MKRWMAIFLICVFTGVSAGATFYLLGTARMNRDNYVYNVGHRDGLNDCEKKAGFILPNGVTELTETWLTNESL